MCGIALSITEKSLWWIPYYAEEATQHVGEGEEEDEFEGELAELFEEQIAEHYESGTDKWEGGGSGVDRR